MSESYPMNEQEWLTPPTYIEVDENKEIKKQMIIDAIYNLNECISNLYSLDDILASCLAIDLEEFRKSIAELEDK